MDMPIMKIPSEDPFTLGPEIPFRFPIKTLPPEIRDEIYRNTLIWNGSIPPALVAFRGDRKLYWEAIAIFYRINYYGISNDTIEYTELLPVTAAAQIRNLSIGTSVGHALQDWLPTPLRSSKLITSLLFSTTNLSQLQEWTKTCFKHFDKVKVLRLKTCLFKDLLDHYNRDPGLNLAAVIDPYIVAYVNRGLGFEGRLQLVGTTTADIWVWKAETGTVLKWEKGRAERLVVENWW